MPLTLQEKFDKAVACVNGLPKEGPYQPSQDTRLQYYAYYKQATDGDVNTPRPGLLDFTGKAKWDARKNIEGMSRDDAQKAYVELLTNDLRGNSADFNEVLQGLEG